MRDWWYIGVLSASLALVRCEEDGVFKVPPRPDLGFIDAGFPDMGFPDAMVMPDAGFPPPATESVYIQTGDSLYSFDPSQNRSVLVGMFRTNQGPLEDPMVDIAIDENGHMYGGTGTRRDEKRVYLIDPETAFCTFLYQFNDNLNGMAFDGRGRLIVAGEQLSVVDPRTGRVLLRFEAASTTYETSGDVVGLPDGNLYWTVRGENRGDNDLLVRLDPNDGRMTLLGELSRAGLYGLGYANGELYGFTSEGEVVTIDPNSGRVLSTRSLEGLWFGATTNPVVWE